jgi:hypothetical protein
MVSPQPAPASFAPLALPTVSALPLGSSIQHCKSFPLLFGDAQSNAEGCSRPTLSALVSHCYELFGTVPNLNSCVFKQIQTLFAKHPGWHTTAIPRSRRGRVCLPPPFHACGLAPPSVLPLRSASNSNHFMRLLTLSVTTGWGGLLSVTTGVRPPLEPLRLAPLFFPSKL